MAMLATGASAVLLLTVMALLFTLGGSQPSASIDTASVPVSGFDSVKSPGDSNTSAKPAPVVPPAPIPTVPRAAPPNPPAVARPAPRGIFDELKAKPELTLPTWRPGSPPSTEVLCRLLAKAPADIRLSLITLETVNDGQPRFVLQSAPNPSAGSSQWIALAVKKQDAFGAQQQVEVGLFTLQDAAHAHQFQFAWSADAPEWANPDGLRFCKLRLESMSADSVECQLSPVSILPCGTLNLISRADRFLTLSLPQGSLVDATDLRVDIQFAWGNTAFSVERLQPGKMRTLTIPHDRYPIEMDFKLEPPTAEREAGLAYSVHVQCPYAEEVKPRFATEVSTWRQRTIRSDQFDKSQMDDGKLRTALVKGIVSADLARVREINNDGLQQLQQPLKQQEAEWKAARENLAQSNFKLNSLRSSANAQTIQLAELQFAAEEAEVERKAKWLEHRKEGVAIGEELNQWVDGMSQRFREAKSQLTVRWAASLQKDSTLIQLSRTEPPPVAPMLSESVEVEPKAGTAAAKSFWPTKPSLQKSAGSSAKSQK